MKATLLALLARSLRMRQRFPVNGRRTILKSELRMFPVIRILPRRSRPP